MFPPLAGHGLASPGAGLWWLFSVVCWYEEYNPVYKVFHMWDCLLRGFPKSQIPESLQHTGTTEFNQIRHVVTPSSGCYLDLVSWVGFSFHWR